jgi:glycosyltransferase involved in cell wall biosynthesis
LLQGYPNLEYVIIDGGSSDGSVDVIRRYQAWLTDWVSEPDQGQADAINKGLARCTGEVFNWLGSDDILLPGSLASVARAWAALPEPGLVYGLARYIDPAGQDLGDCPAQSPNLTLHKVLQVGRYFLIQPAAFLPTAAVRAVSGLNVSRHFALDVDLYARLRLPYVHVPERLALYRLHGTSKTMTGGERFIIEIDQILREAAQHGVISQRQARVWSSLFAARTCLTPEVRRLGPGLRHLVEAVRVQPSVAAEAGLIGLKGLMRLLVGARLWALGRGLQLRVRQWRQL